MICPSVLAITDKPRSAYAWWRVVAPFRRLQEQGIDARWCWLDTDEMPTLPVAGRVVVAQRVSVKGGQPEHADAWVRRLKAAGAVAVVAELDDDILSPAFIDYLVAVGYLAQASRETLEAERQAAVSMVRAADAVTVSTDALAALARAYTDKPVHVIPNAIDVEWFRARLGPRPSWAKWLTIGWAGGRRPDEDVDPMAVAWGRVARRYPDVRFVVAGHQPEPIYRELDAAGAFDRILKVPWADLDDYPAGYVVDIGCCSVADTPFNRGKSPIKAYEYALAGAAVVASPTVYRDTLRETDEMVTRVDINGRRSSSRKLDYSGVMDDPRNAYIVLPEGVDCGMSVADQWEMKLAYAIEDFRERWRRKHAWRQDVEQHHSLVGQLHRWQSVYQEIAARVGVTAHGVR